MPKTVGSSPTVRTNASNPAKRRFTDTERRCHWVIDLATSRFKGKLGPGGAKPPKSSERRQVTSLESHINLNPRWDQKNDS